MILWSFSTSGNNSCLSNDHIYQSDGKVLKSAGVTKPPSDCDTFEIIFLITNKTSSKPLQAAAL